MRIYGFKALRPDAGSVKEVACVPYDTVDRTEAMTLAVGNPRSFLYVVRPEIALPAETDVPGDVVYAKAAEAFECFKRQGVLRQDGTRHLFVYRQTMGIHVQRGIVACCDVEDYRCNRILKHEKTRRDKEDDRTRHVRTLRANTGPVFLTYRDHSGIDAMVRQIENGVPLYDFVASDGVAHTVWRIAEMDALALTSAFEAVPAFYIADGHHRAAAAVRTAMEMEAENPMHRGDEEYNRFLAVLFPATQLKILPYNRCVRDLNGHSSQTFLSAVKTIFEVNTAEDAAFPKQSCQAGMYLDHQWYQLRWDAPLCDNPVDRLDVSVLQARLMDPVLGIGDPRSSDRIDFVGGIRGIGELERRVDEGRAAVAFSMFPVLVDQMLTIADVGREMPPKSTWFEPKLRSGLLVHPFDV